MNSDLFLYMDSRSTTLLCRADSAASALPYYYISSDTHARIASRLSRGLKVAENTIQYCVTNNQLHFLTDLLQNNGQDIRMISTDYNVICCETGDPSRFSRTHKPTNSIKAPDRVGNGRTLQRIILCVIGLSAK